MRLSHAKILISNVTCHGLLCSVDWWKMIVHVVDIGGIDYHHCLSFLFIIQNLKVWILSSWLIDWLIDWCLTPTLAIFQLYRGVNKFYLISIIHRHASPSSNNKTLNARLLCRDTSLSQELHYCSYASPYCQ